MKYFCCFNVNFEEIIKKKYAKSFCKDITEKFSTHLEPVNSTTVDKGRELSQSVSESITDRREGNDDVKILLHSVHKEGKHSERAEIFPALALGFTGCLHSWPDTLQNI